MNSRHAIVNVRNGRRTSNTAGSIIPKKAFGALFLIVVGKAVITVHGFPTITTALVNTRSIRVNENGNSIETTIKKKKSIRLQAADSGNESSDNNNEDKTAPITPPDIISTGSDVSSTKMQSSQFGDVVSIRKKNSNSGTSSQFGDVVSIRKKKTTSSLLDSDEEILSMMNENVAMPSSSSSGNAASSEDNYEEEIEKRRRRNTIVAIPAVLLAIANYVWQVLHPVTPIQLLASMERQSEPITVIGTNNKPTVIDFWAPWCENCKLSAPTLQAIEKEYGDDVNFVMVNADQMFTDERVYKYVEIFGVDAIPHFAMIDEKGNVETALVGPIPKRVFEADIDTLIENSKRNTDNDNRQELPFQMLDTFRNRPEQRRVHFDQ